MYDHNVVDGQGVTHYDWPSIEARWREVWNRRQPFRTPTWIEGVKQSYVFAACPFTSGSAHLGHVRSYSLADAYARFLRARGDAVLFSMGFDSFGLPSELGARKHQLHPRDWVQQCRRTMREQFDRMGFSFDWERTFDTSDEDLYRWSQWTFLTLLSRGLIYRGNATVDWCAVCETVLARAQVEGGRCWRCGNEVELVSREQWFIRTSAYLEENYARIDSLAGWDKNSTGSQVAVVGRVGGFEVDAETVDGRSLAVFVEQVESCGAAELVLMSPNYPDLLRWVEDKQIQDRIAVMRTRGLARSEHRPEEVQFVETDVRLIVPGATKMLPLVVSPYVDARFGATAILGVPESDVTARAIAERLTKVGGAIAVPTGRRETPSRPAQRFSAADYPISRQRGWGAPIPVVHCDTCGTVPVERDQLPIRLPEDLDFLTGSNPLVTHEGFLHCACPKCGEDARRETDTLDCHVDGVWHWMAFCVPAEARSEEMFAHPECRRWLPAHQIVWGMDGGTYLLSQRMTAKALRDEGSFAYLQEGEPFERVLMHGMVEHDGRKMSKHLGNVVDPDELVSRVGADTVRLAVLHGAAPRNGMTWSEGQIEMCHKFLHRLWAYVHDRRTMLETSEGDAEFDLSDRWRVRLAKWCRAAIVKVTDNMADFQMHLAVQNIMRLFSRIEDFERRVLEMRGSLDQADSTAMGIALRYTIQMLAPVAPHIAEELWSLTGSPLLVCEADWPTAAIGVDARLTGRA